MYPAIERLTGINIIPSLHVPYGYRWMQGMDVYINADNYEVMKTMSTEALLVTLGHLQDMSRMQKSPVEQEEQ
jgi:hypothetical protein